MEAQNVQDDKYQCPDTPTPMTHEQKRQAYVPLGAPTYATNSVVQAMFPHLPTQLSCVRGSSPPSQHKTRLHPQIYPYLAQQHHAQGSPLPIPPHLQLHNKPTPNSLPSNRISISADSHDTVISTGSRHSIFSTPGRDELERKKALVEADEGPFARAISMMDLRDERRWISDGAVEERSGKKMGCGAMCLVM
ncbi:hypothetical protein GQ44DRAFT_777080 [Phaeosphaeriaceae sp. PMI808]|nr:hypothetical protein GQ44DRAFT_777080 [Phaeosphaeriaceae sp. PMI808]